MLLTHGQKLNLSGIDYIVAGGPGRYFLGNRTPHSVAKAKGVTTSNDAIFIKKGITNKWQFTKDAVGKENCTHIGPWPEVITLENLTAQVKAVKNYRG